MAYKSFEEQLSECIKPVERFVNFKIGSRQDAMDIIQETCLAAYLNYHSLKNKDCFKGWIISIARNKCNDYYRKRADTVEISLDSLSETAFTKGNCGITVKTAVSDTLERLGERERQIIYLYFFKELSQDEIARRLKIPLGTVKSRLYYAKQNFRKNYPCSPDKKGENAMQKIMPEKLPRYTITKSEKEPFPVKWKEIMGWLIVPELGEKLTWAMYDFPERSRTELCVMEVTGKAQVHGIEGVEITAVEYDPMGCNSAGGQKEVHRTLVAQLTDTYCRLLAESHTENGVKKYFTFLDGGDFLDNWGFGEDNCGNEVNIAPKGDIIKEGNVITAKEKEFLLDVTGRYIVTIGGKEYDTVCVTDCYTYIEGAMSEQYIDKYGKTVLWRRFNRNDWAFDKYGSKWTELLPDNERVTVNGEIYVHWYDCITDYIL